jgi:hypothetical protein
MLKGSKMNLVTKYTRLAQSVERQPFTNYEASWWSRVRVPDRVLNNNKI